jgi:hypothetical protein
MFDHIGAESSTRITLYTDAHVVRGDLRTRHRRLTDVLNATDASFLVLDNVIFEDFGVRAVVERRYARSTWRPSSSHRRAEVEPTPSCAWPGAGDGHRQRATVQDHWRILLPGATSTDPGGADRPFPAREAIFWSGP